MAQAGAEGAQGRKRAARTAIGMAVVAGVVATLMSVGSAPAEANGLTSWTLIKPKPAPTTTTTKPKPKPPMPERTTLATPRGTIPTFDGPGGRNIGSVGTFFGWPITTPVLERKGEWLHVRLPERPNGKTAWVRATDVRLSSTIYRIVIRRGMKDLTVYQEGWPLMTVPAGLGKAETPTPLGSFFVAVIEQPGPHGYGPIVLDTSAHSEAIQSWQGAGDAIIAMHGPISAKSDAQIGSTGTYISNGCIRLHESDQQRLTLIPLGTPVDIVP